MVPFADKSRRRFLKTAAASTLACGTAAFLSPAFGQLQFDGDKEPEGYQGPTFGTTKKNRFRAGVIIDPNGCQMDRARVIVPIPGDWGKEQQTRIVDENVDGGFSVKMDEVSPGSGLPGCRIAVFTARKLRATREMELTVTIETTRAETLPSPAEETAKLVIPSKPPTSFKPYLSGGPVVELKAGKSRFERLAKEILRDKGLLAPDAKDRNPRGADEETAEDGADVGTVTAWAKIEALHDFVRDKFTYDASLNAKEPKGALDAINDGKWTADCKDMTFVFIALCRVMGVPARCVRLPTHCYAEFYLEKPGDSQAVDEKGSKTKTAGRGASKTPPPEGFWFPCQLAGDRAFGEMASWDPILQKGDNFADELEPKKRVHYVLEQFGGAYTNIPPSFRFIHELKPIS